MKQYIINNWLIDPSSGSIISQISGEKKRLGEYQIKLLTILVSNAGKTLSREQLMNLVWENRVIGNNSLPNAIHALRLAIEDDGKEQKIIKTMPKIGYMIEEEYCHSIDIKPDEIKLTKPAGQLAVVAEIQQLTEKQHPDFIYCSRRSLYTLYLIGLVLTIAVGYLLFDKINPEIPHTTRGNSSIIIKPQSRQIYSNIIFKEIFPINATNIKDTSNDRLLEKKLEPTLTKLNQELVKTNVQMLVYFRMREAILNSVFVLTTHCDRKDFSMHIYHWRINNELLNSVTYRETMRKLDKMANCTAKQSTHNL